VRGSVDVLGDVEDVAVGRPDEEAEHAPRLRRERVHDLVAALPSLRQRRLDVVDPDRGDRVLGGGRVVGEELDARPRLGEENRVTQSMLMDSSSSPR
jgi:hypothetical protein